MEAVRFLNQLESSTLQGLNPWQVTLMGSILLLTTLLTLRKLSSIGNTDTASGLISSTQK